ncbi:interleukin-32-like isoform X3 [Ovis canadensis]|uniref:interleukin-32-like isoform X3 n=1 Tax=Ovis canadensis TaxID=37174 RepID=UPI003750253A
MSPSATRGSTLSAPPWPALKSLGLSRQPGSAQLELWLQDLRSQREDPNPPWASLREKNRASFTQVHLCSQHRSVDHYCDRMGNEPEEAQMEAALAEMEEELSKDVCEFMEDHIQENFPESLQESSPLLQQVRQEVRRRIQRPSVTACLEVQNPEESIWARALRRFQGMLRRLQQRCWDVLTWLQEKAAACLEAVCSAVKAVWGVLTDFCSSVGQLFRNVIQV